AERVSGPIPRSAPPAHVWGDAIALLDAARPHARVINLETSITSRGRFWPGKGIHYRMHPANLPVLEEAGVDVCVLANNHVLDFGREGLLDTVRALDDAGIARCGAGANLADARRPARVPLPGGRSLLVFGVGHGSSGIPSAWAAGRAIPGVDLLPDLGPHTADALLRRIGKHLEPGA